jgi:hypothetical protein
MDLRRFFILVAASKHALPSALAQPAPEAAGDRMGWQNRHCPEAAITMSRATL